MLRAEQLAAIRGERLVFEHVSFEVSTGGAMLLVGPNGSGKSTLLRVLAGLKRAGAGRVLWHGEDVAREPGAHATRLAYVGHQNAVKPGLTVGENLFRTRTNRAPAALAAMGLEALVDMPARMLSAGQLRRLALARLAAGRSDLWLLDEPSLGLDAAAVERFGALAAMHRAQGGVVVAATHLPLPLPGAMEFALA